MWLAVVSRFRTLMKRNAPETGSRHILDLVTQPAMQSNLLPLRRECGGRGVESSFPRDRGVDHGRGCAPRHVRGARHGAPCEHRNLPPRNPSMFLSERIFCSREEFCTLLLYNIEPTRASIVCRLLERGGERTLRSRRRSRPRPRAAARARPSPWGTM